MTPSEGGIEDSTFEMHMYNVYWLSCIYHADRCSLALIKVIHLFLVSLYLSTETKVQCQHLQIGVNDVIGYIAPSDREDYINSFTCLIVLNEIFI